MRHQQHRARVDESDHNLGNVRVPVPQPAALDRKDQHSHHHGHGDQDTEQKIQIGVKRKAHGCPATVHAHPQKHTQQHDRPMPEKRADVEIAARRCSPGLEHPQKFLVTEIAIHRVGDGV